MLARIPGDENERDPLRFCVELMTVMVLRISHHAFQQYVSDILPHPNRADRLQLILLAGFALGILASEQHGDANWEQELLEHVKQYQSIVIGMSLTDCRQLAHALEKVLAPLRTTTTNQTDNAPAAVGVSNQGE
jgi:hypothetical protein